jgi:hypothetical protein
MYREDELVTMRWLVDSQGRVLDTARFPRSREK